MLALVSLKACTSLFIYNLCLQRSAALVYEDSRDVQKAVSHASSGQVIECVLPLPEGPLGLKSWVAAHKAQRPGNQQLQKQVTGV